MADMEKGATSKLNVLVTGRTGSGKSALVNGILGMNIEDQGAATESKSNVLSRACTTELKEYRRNKSDVLVTVWDTPGLQDGTSNQDAYLQQMRDNCTHIDLTLYCINSSSTRFVSGTENPDVVAMMTLTQTFGANFWKNTLIVLTFANTIESFHIHWKRYSSQQKKVAFRAVIQEWKSKICEILVRDAAVPLEIVNSVKIIPAGHYVHRSLLDREYWLSDLWFGCLGAISSPGARGALLTINSKRMKNREDVSEADFQQAGEFQPIVVSHHNREILVGIAKHAAIGGAIGGIASGIIAFPIALVSIPVGVVVGAAMGTSWYFYDRYNRRP